MTTQTLNIPGISVKGTGIVSDPKTGTTPQRPNPEVKKAADEIKDQVAAKKPEGDSTSQQQDPKQTPQAPVAAQTMPVKDQVDQSVVRPRRIGFAHIAGQRVEVKDVGLRPKSKLEKPYVVISGKYSYKDAEGNRFSATPGTLIFKDPKTCEFMLDVLEPFQGSLPENFK